MKAVVMKAVGEVGVTDVPLPAIGPTDVLVHVAASGLNRADLLVLNGMVHGKQGGAGALMGMECAGTVEAVGSEVTAFQPGDRVMGLAPGAFAEYAIAHHQRIFPVPTGMSLTKAAILPVALLTMHDAIVTKGGLQAGQSVLILGATSAVGMMGLQIARYRGAKTIIGTSTRAERRAQLPEWGATATVDTSAPDWDAEILEMTDGRGVDLVIDMLAGPNVIPAMRATAIGGRLINVGRLAGERVEVDLDLHSLRQLTHIGVTFRTRTAEQVAEVVRRMQADLGDGIARGELRLPITEIMSLDDAGKAFARLAADDAFGKIVLEP